MSITPELIAHLWDLGAVEALCPLGGGSINGAFRVKAERGEFHLRAYRSLDQARAEREHAAIALAVQVGLPTPAPLPTRAGETVAASESGLLALFPVAPGEAVPRSALTTAHAAALGTFLAGVHDRLPSEVPFEVPVLRIRGAKWAIDRLERIEAILLALPAPDEVDGWALRRTQQRLAHLRTSPLPEHAPTFPARFLHGDYHEGNVFFVGEGPTALIDWEQTRLAPRAWEIVRCLSLSLRLKPGLCRAFLEGYRARLPLPSAELTDGAAFYSALQEQDVWTYESVYVEGHPGPRRFIGPPPYVPFQVRWADLGLS